MVDELVSIADIARQCGVRRQSIFKVLRRLRIEPEKRKSPEKHGQIASYITRAESEIVIAELSGMREAASAPSDLLPAEVGVFYVIQLEPTHDPGRVKVGFASNIGERLRAHRTSAPFAEVIKTWPCRSLWEKTAIDCVCNGFEQLHTEVFRTDSIDQIVENCDEFFSIMPRLTDGQ